MSLPVLIPGGVPLDGVPGLPPAQVRALQGLWITTAQELVGLAHSRPVRLQLAAALDVDLGKLDRAIEAAQRKIPATRSLRHRQLELEALAASWRSGALLDEPAAELARRTRLPAYRPPAATRAPLPPSVVRIDELPPVRDQGSRSTCVAYAALALREHLEILAGSPLDIDLSEQYLYWWCKQHDGAPERPGTYVSLAMRGLEQVGAPPESAWPYAADQAGDEGQGPPPPAAAEGSAAFRTARTLEFNRTDLAGIKACLAAGRLVAVAVPIFPSWFESPATRRWGKLTMPLPEEQPDGGHALALVGYQDDPEVPGGGYFLARNSWSGWAYDSIWQPGHACIPYAYIAQQAADLRSAERVAVADLLVGSGTPGPVEATPSYTPHIWPGGAAGGPDDGVYVRAGNRGPAYAYQVELELCAAPLAPYIRPQDWQLIGRQQAARLAPGEERVFGPLSRTPAAGGERPYAYRARLKCAADPAEAEPGRAAESHVWQSLLPPGGSAAIEFIVADAPGATGLPRLQVDRSALPARAALTPIHYLRSDSAEISPAVGPYAGVMNWLSAFLGSRIPAPGRRRATLALTLPTDVLPGSQYRLIITQRQGDGIAGQMVWRINVGKRAGS